MLENEELFEQLVLADETSHRAINELIEFGYFTPDLHRTLKADLFVQHFIEELKLPLYVAMRQSHNDMRTARQRVGLSRYQTYHAIAQELVKEGLMKQDDFGDYIAN